MDGMYFQTLKAYYSCIHKWLVSLRRLFASSYICWMEAGSRAAIPAECHRSWDLETNNWPWRSSACFACISKHEADLLGSQAWVVTTFLRGNKNKTPMRRFCFLPLWFSSNLTFLVPALSAFHIPSTSSLCAPCSANSSSWKSCGSSAATRVLSWRCG